MFIQNIFSSQLKNTHWQDSLDTSKFNQHAKVVRKEGVATKKFNFMFSTVFFFRFSPARGEIRKREMRKRLDENAPEKDWKNCDEIDFFF